MKTLYTKHFENIQY